MNEGHLFRLSATKGMKGSTERKARDREKSEWECVYPSNCGPRLVPAGQSDAF